MRRYLPISVAILIWSWTAIFVRLLKAAAFDPFSQNFYRYLAASVVLLGITRAMNPDGFRRALRRPWRFLLPGLTLAAFQTCFVLGVYRVQPAFAGIIGTSDLLLVMLLALFFADERRVVLNPRFLAAVAVGAGSVVGFILLDPLARFEWTGEARTFYTGTGLILLGAAMWVVHSYAVKRIVGDTGPLVSFSFSATCATAVLFAVAAVAQEAGWEQADLGHVADVRAVHLLLLFGSGVLNVGIAQAFFHQSVRLLGVSLTRSLELVIPLLTALFSYLVLGEVLTPGQWGCGLVLLGAVGYLTLLGQRFPVGPPGAEAAPDGSGGG